MIILVRHPDNVDDHGWTSIEHKVWFVDIKEFEVIAIAERVPDEDLRGYIDTIRRMWFFDVSIGDHRGDTK